MRAGVGRGEGCKDKGRKRMERREDKPPATRQLTVLRFLCRAQMLAFCTCLHILPSCSCVLCIVVRQTLRLEEGEGILGPAMTAGKVRWRLLVLVEGRGDDGDRWANRGWCLGKEMMRAGRVDLSAEAGDRERNREQPSTKQEEKSKRGKKKRNEPFFTNSALSIPLRMASSSRSPALALKARCRRGRK